MSTPNRPRRGSAYRVGQIIGGVLVLAALAIVLTGVAALLIAIWRAVL